MTDSSGRRFTLADAMILVAAIAIGLVLTRIASNHRLPLDHGELSVPISALLFSLMLAVLLLTMWEPKVIRHDAMNGPGFIACCAVLLGAILTFTVYGWAIWADQPDAYKYLGGQVCHTLTERVGPMILSAWVTMALLGRWKLRGRWTDWLGCVLALCWVGLYLSSEIHWTRLIMSLSHFRID